MELPKSVRVFLTEAEITLRSQRGRDVEGFVTPDQSAVVFRRPCRPNPVVKVDELGHLLGERGAAANVHHRWAFKALEEAVRRGDVVLTAAQEAELQAALEAARLGL